MAIPFLNNINLDDNQLLNAKLHVTSSVPTVAQGQIYFDSTTSPNAINTAKYYDGSAWISLVEHSFTNDSSTFVNLTETGTDATRTLTAQLSATGTPSATTYLRGDNAWEPISAIPGTYEFTLSDNASPTPVTGVIAEDDVVIIAANNDLTSNLTGQTGTTKTLTIGLKVDGGVGVSDNYIVNQNTAVADADDSIPFNQNTDYGNPTFDTDIVKKTTFGTIPVTALTAVKTYIDNAVAGGLVYQGGYNAATNTPDLDSSPSSSIKKGWTYTVTADGSFFTEQVRVGDVLIAEQDAPTTLADWTTVQNNIDLASLTQVGIGNVNASTDSDKVGLSVSYSSGTANIGFDVNSLTQSLPQTDNTDAYIAYYDDDASTNKKITFEELAEEINTETSFATTISATGTIAHNLTTRDVIVQLYDTVTYETVYADVDRISTSQVTITFASTPTNDIRVLVQKIG